jgi:hypothetical protein
MAPEETNPYRGPLFRGRRLVPFGVGLVLALVFSVVMEVAGASDVVRLAVGFPLLALLIVWALFYAFPERYAGEQPRGADDGREVGKETTKATGEAAS